MSIPQAIQLTLKSHFKDRVNDWTSRIWLHSGPLSGIKLFICYLLQHLTARYQNISIAESVKLLQNLNSILFSEWATEGEKINYGKSRIFGITVFFYNDEVSRCTMHKKKYILTQENHIELEAAGGNID